MIDQLAGQREMKGQEYYSRKDGGTVDACQRDIEVDGN